VGCDIHPSICASQCINGGYYCAVDPDGDPDTGISGGDVVLENLRSQCAWEEASSTFTSDFGQAWWRYATLYEQACTDPSRWGAACSTAQLRAAGYSDSALVRIATCVTNSNLTAASTATDPACRSDPFAGYCDWTNTKLQLELNLMEDMGVTHLPSLMVEGVELRGNLAPAVALGAVCTAFGTGSSLPGGKIPAVCACGGAAGLDVKACLASLNPAAPPAASSSMPGWAVAVLIFSLFALAAAGAAIWYIRRTRGEVEEMFEQYSSLPSDSEFAAGGGVVEQGEGQGSLQQAPGGGFLKGGRGFRPAPKFQGSGSVFAMLPAAPSWLSDLLTPPPSHAFVSVPADVPPAPAPNPPTHSL
jgi:hypothetical protein